MSSSIKWLLCACVSAAALSATSALADPQAPMSGWTGCYIGANAGGVWAHENRVWTTESGVALGFYAPRASISADGGAYGGQVGCDYQFNNRWIIGGRAIWDGASASGSKLDPLPNIGNSTDQIDHTNIDSLGTLTARVGFLPSPTTMLYVLGGAAWVQERYSITDALAGGTILSSSKSPFGYDVGGGFSWKFAPAWDVWTEYDHMGFGSYTDTAVVTAFHNSALLGFSEKQSADKVLVGIDYRFDLGG